jgi:aspartate aminotransferase
VEPDDILITTGGSEAIQFAFMTLCDPYDEVIIPEPYYTNVDSFAKVAMVNLVPVTSKFEDGFACLRSASSPRRSPARQGRFCFAPQQPHRARVYQDELLALLKLVKEQTSSDR